MKKFSLLALALFPQLLWGQSTILRNVNIIDVINERIVEGQSIEIKSGLILNIHDSTYIGNEEDTIIDLSGKYVIPGLIDSHTHIEHSGYWTKQSKYNPPRENLLALLNHALIGGVTTIREMACDVRVVGELSRAAQLNIIPSPDIVYPSVFAGSEFFDDPRSIANALGKSAGSVSWGRTIENDTDLIRVIAEAKGNGSSALKLYDFLSKEQINAIVKEAKKQDLLVYGHAFTEYAKPSEIISSGINDISHAYLLMYELSDKPDFASYSHGDNRLDEVFDLMKSYDVSLDPTVFLFEKYTPITQFSGAVERITKDAHDAGVRIVAGTDTVSAYQDAPFPFIHDEIMYYVTKCDFSNMEALQTATINPAITLRLDKEIGSLDIGKKANIVVLEQNPIDNIQNTKSILMTIKDGIIYQRE